MSVGIRELKSRLSEFVNRAANGERIVVTDRGREVAELVPLSSTNALDRGVAEGWVEPPRRSRLEPIERLNGSQPSLDVLEEDRG